MLVSHDDWLVDHEAEEQLRGIVGALRHFFCIRAFLSLPSTNDYALLLEKSTAPSGTVIIARHQSHGRGRLKRAWQMQDGDIAMSIILRPPHLPKNRALLSMIPALAMVEALAELDIKARLKWPNDIIVQSAGSEHFDYCGNFQKLGGILVENVFCGNELVASIIGMGLNMVSKSHLKALVPHVACLQDMNQGISKIAVIGRMLGSFDQIISLIDNSNFEYEIINKYKKYCETLGKKVSFEISGCKIYGYVKDIQTDGSLIVYDGIKEHRVLAGEVNCTMVQRLA